MEVQIEETGNRKQMLWLFCQAHWGLPVGFLLLGIQFYSLLSPYLCFISLLYLDLYFQGDYALIGLGSFMLTKYLCVLIHI